MQIRRQLAFFATNNVPGNCLAVIMGTHTSVPQAPSQATVWGRDALRCFFLSPQYPLWGLLLIDL